MEEYTARVMQHPQATPAQIVKDEARGTPAMPARFPPVEVHSEDQEAEYRSKGYLLPGESPASVPGWAEYPKMLVHPDHEDAVPDVPTAFRDASGSLIQSLVKGQVEKYPNVFVKDAEEEAAWAAKGYAPPGIEDPQAFGRATSSAKPETYRHDEYPKWVDGKLTDDPSKPPPGADSYPKMVYGPPKPGEFEGQSYTVRSRKEELELLSKLGVPYEPDPEPEPEPAVSDDHAAEFAEFLAWRAMMKAKEAPTAGYMNEVIDGLTERLVLVPVTDVARAPIIEAATEIVAVLEENGVAERAVLVAQAAERGIELDRRWGVKRIRQALENG